MKRKLAVFGTIEYIVSQIEGHVAERACIGGNGLIASLAAGEILPIYLIGIIGKDISLDYLQKAVGENISIENIEQYNGQSFRYKVTYDNKNYAVKDEKIDFGVYGKYKPKITSSEIKHIPFIFFSGSNPKYSLKVISQLDGRQTIGVNTLFYHLIHNFTYSKKLIEKTTYLFMSKKEYEFLDKKIGNLFTFCKSLKIIFITNGKEGIEVIARNSTFVFPVTNVVIPLNPTNAGDVFSATVMGMIAKGYSLEKELPKIIRIAQKEAVRVISNDSYYRKLKGDSMKKTNKILDKILANKVTEIKEKKQKISLEELKKSLPQRQTKVRDFASALGMSGKLNIMGEIKKSSPSRGLIREDFNHIEIAKIYEKSRLVDAISILTDEKYFQGKLPFIKDIKKVTTIPIFRKDFIIDEYQIYETYIAEADALLLIVAALREEDLKHLIELTHSLQMECLVEIHSKEELKVALRAGAKIVGVNARDLKTFTIDKTLFGKIARYIPSHVLKVAESGIENHEDIARLGIAGADAVLIGTSFMNTKNIEAKIYEMMRGDLI